MVKQKHSGQDGVTASKLPRASGSSSSVASFSSSNQDMKKGMAENNERLANLLNRKRELEIENENLFAELRTRDEYHAKELAGVKEVLEKKIEDSETLIDQLTREKAKVIIDYDRIKSMNHDLIATNEALQREVVKITKTNEQIIKEKDELLSQETLRSVSLENRLKSVTEQLKTNQLMEEKKLRDMRQQLEEQCHERLNRELEQELDRIVEEQQREFDREIRVRREEIRQQLQDDYEEKLSALQDKLWHKEQIEKKQCEDLIVLQNKVVQQSSTERDLRDRMLDLQNELETLKSELMESVLKKENEIKALENTLKSKESEFAHVLNDRNALAEEVANYQRLLDGEEQRATQLASADGSGGDGGQPGSFRAMGSPRRISTGNRKRPRMSPEEENHIDTLIEYEGDGPVRIVDFDQEGKYVRLINDGLEPVPIGGWWLKRTVDSDLYQFKFGKSIVIKPKATVTVWSKNSDAVHELPTSIVMKANWPVGPMIETVLLDADQNQLYRRTSKQQVRRIKKRMSSINRIELSPQSEKCCLM